jgi:glycosyltransferase involved in cell wall biosynthesis
MLLTRAYYLLKPAIPWKLRLALRRRRARRLRRRLTGDWHTNAIAGSAPEGWPGWPDGKQFAFVLTHDVDGPRGLRRTRELAEMEMRLGFRSSFNFVPEGAYVAPPSLRRFLTDNGFEVGVHDLRHDGKLYGSRAGFSARARDINRYLAEWESVGFRSAFMLHDLDWLRDLDILYDASAFDTDPFEPQPDGVNTIFPFWVSRDDGSGYVELPYTLPQDSTLFVMLQESSIDIWKRKLDWVAQHGGMALMNVHPDYMTFEGRPHATEYPARLYEEFLQYVATRYGRQGWFALPREVAAYVRRDIRTPAPSADDPAPSVDDRTPSWRLRGKRVAMLAFSYYPLDPRPRRTAEALADEGMNVDVICLKEAAEPKRETLHGVEILRLPLKRRRGGMFEYVFQYAAFIVMAFSVLAARSLTRRYDVVYVHNMPDVLVLSALVPKALGAKVILDLHDPMPELMMSIFALPQDSLPVRMLKRLETWSMRLADLVLTVNVACKRLFVARGGGEDKIQVVMNAPDHRIFGFRPPAPAPARPEGHKPFVIMYHGSLVERNGLHLAVDALARLRESVPSAQLRIYGPATPFLDTVMASVRARGLSDAVQYLGLIRLEDIVEAIAQCDVGIIPNQRSIFTELNTPTRVFEYLAVGKPVIAPRAAGIQDYFDEDSLVFFELGDAEDLARKIEYVFHHPREALEVVRRGQEVYRAHAWREEKRTLLTLTAGLLRGTT